MTDPRETESNARAAEDSDTTRVNPWRVVVILLWIFLLLLGAILLGSSGQFVGRRLDPQIGVTFAAINLAVAGMLFTVMGFVILIKWLFVELAAWKSLP